MFFDKKNTWEATNKAMATVNTNVLDQKNNKNMYFHVLPTSNQTNVIHLVPTKVCFMSDRFFLLDDSIF